VTNSDQKNGELINLKSVKKIYNLGAENVHALDGIDLDINRNEYISIMGPSGSGKSTLMNLIGCLDTPTKGKYLLNGQLVSQLTDDELARIRSKEIGFVFQTFNLLARTSALENVELPLMYNPIVRAKEMKERAMHSLEMVGLADWHHHYPNQLSGGQQQRVAIARALVNDPVVVLADEPTGNLDTARSLEIMELLTRFNREQGISIIMVTHEAEMAAFARRKVHFLDGLIVDGEQQKGEGD